MNYVEETDLEIKLESICKEIKELKELLKTKHDDDILLKFRLVNLIKKQFGLKRKLNNERTITKRN